VKNCTIAHKKHYSHSHTDKHTQTLTLSHPQTHSNTHTLTPTNTLKHSNTHTLTPTNTLKHSHSHTYTHKHTQTLSLTLMNSHMHTLYASFLLSFFHKNSNLVSHFIVSHKCIRFSWGVLSIIFLLKSISSTVYVRIFCTKFLHKRLQSCVLGLTFLGAKILAQNAHIKC